MEICILGFKGSRAAGDAYAAVLELEGEDNRWLLEVGTIARPLVEVLERRVQNVAPIEGVPMGH